MPSSRHPEEIQSNGRICPSARRSTFPVILRQPGTPESVAFQPGNWRDSGATPTLAGDPPLRLEFKVLETIAVHVDDTQAFFKEANGPLRRVTRA